jgi:two-component system chemotaxis response regulator CheB
MSPNESDAAVKRGAFRVLVIDDNEIDREIAIRCIGEAWPFERELAVEAAADGAEALDKMRRMRFTLVVLDWRLPAMGGADVLRAIRANGVRLPVVVLSGLMRHQILDDIEALDASFLNKDEMTPETFRAAVADSLRMLGHATSASSGS